MKNLIKAFILLFLITSVSPAPSKLTRYTVKEGNHHFNKRKLKLYCSPEVIEFSFYFDQNYNYDLDGSDQKDWNKLTGLAWSISAQKDAVMIGDRLNLDNNMIELNAYYHIEGERTFTAPLMAVTRFETGTGKIEVDYQAKIYTVTLQRSGGPPVTHTKSFTHNRKLARRVNPWFGGNQAAPQKVDKYLEFH